MVSGFDSPALPAQHCRVLANPYEVFHARWQASARIRCGYAEGQSGAYPAEEMSVLYLAWRSRAADGGRSAASPATDQPTSSPTRTARSRPRRRFRPLLGFPEQEEVYRSESLFPVFANRLMTRRGPSSRASSSGWIYRPGDGSAGPAGPKRRPPRNGHVRGVLCAGAHARGAVRDALLRSWPAPPRRRRPQAVAEVNSARRAARASGPTRRIPKTRRRWRCSHGSAYRFRPALPARDLHTLEQAVRAGVADSDPRQSGSRHRCSSESSQPTWRLGQRASSPSPDRSSQPLRPDLAAVA